MSDKIRLLPDVVASQIAAGEVVNRPASVVKEMMENAVDAGAHSITVSYRNGGKEFIKVIDDGEGMSATDARLAFDKHATSKITRIDDIYSLHTFGFRGEALASIAAVAHVELATRQADDEIGTRIVIEGCKFQCQEPTVTPVGSQFTVKNLFFNVPARRRALDKSTTEHKHIAEEFRRVAMCHPEMSFSLYGDDVAIFSLPPSNLKKRIAGLIGKSSASNLLEISTETSIVSVRGFVGKPEACRQSNREQYLYVNGRYFKSPYFHKAVMQAYEKLIPAGAQPSYFLFFETDPDKIDVNIHPQKIEIQFENGSAIWQIVNAAVRETLAKTGVVSFMDFQAEGNIEIPVTHRDDVINRIPPSTLNPSYNPFGHTAPRRGGSAGLTDMIQPDYNFDKQPVRHDWSDKLDQSVLDYIENGSEQQSLQLDTASNTISEPVVLSGGYVAASWNGELVIVDLRRAKEVILFERFKSMLGNDTSVTQKLMFPQSVVLSNDDVSFLAEHTEEFAALGFEYSTSNDNTLEVTGIPADAEVENAQDMLYDMIDAMRDETASAERRRETFAAIMARNGARHSGAYSRGEITAILETISDGGNYNYTFDGNPVLRRISSDEIKKLFFK